MGGAVLRGSPGIPFVLASVLGSAAPHHMTKASWAGSGGWSGEAHLQEGVPSPHWVLRTSWASGFVGLGGISMLAAQPLCSLPSWRLLP